MAATAKPYFTRPIENVYTGTLATFDATYAITMDVGTYACVEAFLMSFVAEVNNETTVPLEMKMDDDGYLCLRVTTGSSSLSFDSTHFRSILGFASNLSLTTSWSTATYYPGVLCSGIWEDRGPYTWRPTYRYGDQGVWSTQPRGRVRGTTSNSGRWAGTSSGALIYYREMSFPHELDTNLITAAQAGSIDYSLESFKSRALEDEIQDDESASTKGFWYYEDHNNMIADCASWATDKWSEASDIGVQFWMDSSPKTKVFCDTSPSELPSSWGQSPSLPSTTLRMHETFAFHTSSAPTWKYVALS